MADPPSLKAGYLRCCEPGASPALAALAGEPKPARLVRRVVKEQIRLALGRAQTRLATDPYPHSTPAE